MERRNIEIKARLHDLAAARRTAEQVATRRLGVQRQIDTYFHCPTVPTDANRTGQPGRLKLREIDGQTAQLVSYARPDRPGPKPSDYTLVPVADAALFKQALTAALGVWRVIDKRREIFLADNVRIHLDEVQGLGAFLEFEAVLEPPYDDALGRRQLDALLSRFQIAPSDLLSGSYSDLIGEH